jgi:CheY-like chemotaxis protein
MRMVGRTVLVVDDNESLREALVILLGGEGYDVVTASNGREALDRLRDTEPCIILLDYAMPVMDGRAFRDAQKANRRWAGIPVVVITAHHREPAARSIDALAILQKPLSYETLAPLLEFASGHESRREEEELS